MDLSLATIVLWAVPVVFAITLHEAAHGYVARMFGDQTAWMLGRVTLNPIKHIDPVGTILVPGMLVAVAAVTHTPTFIFGWAKPVPVNFGNLRIPKRDMFWVAGAGPLANFAMAVAWGLLLKGASPGGIFASNGLLEMAGAGIQINDAAGVEPVTHSSARWRTHCSEPAAAPLAAATPVGPYGFMVVIILLATGILSDLMRPILRVAEYALGFVLGL
jgi:Zn-dependent protease